MLVTLIPLFDENMAIKAYSLFTQKKNYFLNPMLLGTGQLDGAGRVEGLEVIQNMGIETVSGDKDVLVAVNNMALFSDLEEQCQAPNQRLVLLIDTAVKPTSMYVDRIMVLKEKGYRFAIRKVQVADFEAYREIFKLMDYVLINHKKVEMSKAQIYFRSLYPNITICAVGVDTQEEFERLRSTTAITTFEGEFYRLPINKGEHEVSPLKMNYIELLNTVNQEDYDLTDAADIVGRDTALTISLLRLANNLAINSEITSIRHAAAMLGQKELKKWITTAVVGELCADKPNEINRVSMLRAKFAENMAPLFGLATHTSELFLMGLFSLVDVILDVPMKEAIDMVNVSKDIKDALLNHEGRFAAIYDFIIQYENAGWQEVSRQMILQNIDMNDVYDAYTKALVWYRKLTLGD